MARKKLSMEMILSAATELVEEKGYEQFSLRELAGKLKVQPSSLYNHTSNVSEITAGVGHLALKTLSERMKIAGEGLCGKEKLIALAKAYRLYAKETPELYKAIASIPSLADEGLREETNEIMSSLYEILNTFGLAPEECIMFARAMRSAMHGFVTLESMGHFQNGADVDESYRYMIESLLYRLELTQKEGSR